jgi:hypothetical protein
MFLLSGRLDSRRFRFILFGNCTDKAEMKLQQLNLPNIWTVMTPIGKDLFECAVRNDLME